MGIEYILGNTNVNPFSRKNAIILTLRASVPFNAVLLLGFFFNHNVPLQNLVIPILYMFACNLLLFYILFLFNFKLKQMTLKKWERSVFIGLGCVTISIVISSLSTILLHFFSQLGHQDLYRYFIIDLIKGFVAILIVQISMLVIALSKQEQDAAIEHEKLLTENIRTRYEVLKSQIDPHFIFNSLNTLDGLIGVDDGGAREYLQNFSFVFRYVINNKEVTKLCDELDFTESYAAMIRIRYGDNFRIEYHIDEKFKEWLIMPISLQLLVENAVKHNVISKNHPLLVTIETTEKNTIRVKNNMNLKKESEHGAGIGLANLTDRYRYLFHKEVSITQSDDFSVEIPLIKQKKTAKIEKVKI